LELENIISLLSLAHMSISTYFRPNIHQKGPEILGVHRQGLNFVSQDLHIVVYQRQYVFPPSLSYKQEDYSHTSACLKRENFGRFVELCD
jgi:hypothetical protein